MSAQEVVGFFIRNWRSLIIMKTYIQLFIQRGISMNQKRPVQTMSSDHSLPLCIWKKHI